LSSIAEFAPEFEIPRGIRCKRLAFALCDSVSHQCEESKPRSLSDTGFDLLFGKEVDRLNCARPGVLQYRAQLNLDFKIIPGALLV
jgi:hypothetical protein